MKRPIGFAVVRRICSDGWHVLAITSENRGRVYGRGEDDMPTSRAHRDVVARFEGEAEARDAIDRLRKVDAAYAPHLKAAEEAVRRLQEGRGKARATVARGETPTLPAPLVAGACYMPGAVAIR